MKTVKVNEDNHIALLQLKLDLRLSTVDEVISYLVDKAKK